MNITARENIGNGSVNSGEERKAVRDSGARLSEARSENRRYDLARTHTFDLSLCSPADASF